MFMTNPFYQTLLQFTSKKLNMIKHLKKSFFSLKMQFQIRQNAQNLKILWKNFHFLNPAITQKKKSLH